MAFKRKTSSAPSQDFASSDVKSGNNKFNEGVKIVDWPDTPEAPQDFDKKVEQYAPNKNQSQGE